MLATVLHAPGDVRYDDVDEPSIVKPTDAIIKLSATCICGSDVWPYRGVQKAESDEGVQPDFVSILWAPKNSEREFFKMAGKDGGRFDG